MRPGEFETAAGKGAAKKWKASIRVHGGEHDNMELGKYLQHVLGVRIMR